VDSKGTCGRVAWGNTEVGLVLMVRLLVGAEPRRRLGEGHGRRAESRSPVVRDTACKTGAVPVLADCQRYPGVDEHRQIGDQEHFDTGTNAGTTRAPRGGSTMTIAAHLVRLGSSDDRAAVVRGGSWGLLQETKPGRAIDGSIWALPGVRGRSGDALPLGNVVAKPTSCGARECDGGGPFSARRPGECERGVSRRDACGCPPGR
jgi:hypothetical protein